MKSCKVPYLHVLFKRWPQKRTPHTALLSCVVVRPYNLEAAIFPGGVGWGWEESAVSISWTEWPFTLMKPTGMNVKVSYILLHMNYRTQETAWGWEILSISVIRNRNIFHKTFTETLAYNLGLSNHVREIISRSDSRRLWEMSWDFPSSSREESESWEVYPNVK